MITYHTKAMKVHEINELVDIKLVYANYARDLNFSHRSVPTDIKDMMR